MSLPSRLLLVACLALAVPLTGCQTLQYEAWEMLGREKRDLLRSELGGLVDDQEEAQESFQTALERVKGLTAFDGGELEAEYLRLKDAYEAAESDADSIDSRIDDIQQISSDMFVEWEREIGEMQTRSLAEKSREKLRQTRRRYDELSRSMVGSRDGMRAVLPVLRDHVLYLKHNLNAAAVGALGEEMGEVERDIEELQRTLQTSIAEAQAFIAELPQ